MEKKDKDKSEAKLAHLTEMHRNFIRVLRNEMARRGLDVKAVASGTGIPEKGIYNILYGHWPPPERIEPIARFLRLNVADFFGEPTAIRRPTLPEAMRVIEEAAEKFSKVPDLSNVPSEILARLSAADYDELADVKLVFEAHGEEDREFEAELDEPKRKQRKKR